MECRLAIKQHGTRLPAPADILVQLGQRSQLEGPVFKITESLSTLTDLKKSNEGRRQEQRRLLRKGFQAAAAKDLRLDDSKV